VDAHDEAHRGEAPAAATFQETFSVVIPTFRRPERLEACLRALAQLDYPRHLYEVVVVNDGTENAPREVVENFASQVKITLLTQPHAGPAAARNTGARAATRKFLAFTDDDCVPDAGWLSAFARRLAAAPDMMVGGLTVNALTDNVYSSASQMLTDYLYTYFRRDDGQGSFFASNNLCVQTDLFRAVGGFDPNLTTGEDREFCDRWEQAGYRLAYVSEALIYHSHSLTLSTFWQQHFDYGRGAAQWRKTHFKRSAEPIQFGGSKFAFYSRMLRHPFSCHLGARAPLFSALLALTQIAYISGAIWEMSTAQ
jgi:GT2 family glycosyltransferase